MNVCVLIQDFRESKSGKKTAEFPWQTLQAFGCDQHSTIQMPNRNNRRAHQNSTCEENGGSVQRHIIRNSDNCPRVPFAIFRTENHDGTDAFGSGLAPLFFGLLEVWTGVSNRKASVDDAPDRLVQRDQLFIISTKPPRHCTAQQFSR